MPTKKALVSVAVAAACAVGVWKLGAGLLADGDAAGTKRLTNQLWIERMPQDERDMVGYLAMVRTDHGRFGVAGRASQWRQFTEVFRWALEGDRLTAVFPQERKRARFNVKTWECKDEAPRPFELCLKIGRGQRSHTFYSMHEWEIRPQDQSIGGLEDYPVVDGMVELPDQSIEIESGDDYSEADADWSFDSAL